MPLALFTLLVVLVTSCGESPQKAAAASTEFDVIILNGRVMDPETNFDQIQNVGILDGKIALITDKEIKGKETIDAKGHVVAPGFIDSHQHCIEPYGLKTNKDGSIDIYFAPEAPKGYENNWIQTIPGKSWFIILRAYGPLAPWIDKTWRPGELELVE